jgi:uncharacterized membrane protein YczE
MTKTKTNNLLKRCSAFVVGLFIMAMGVALSVKAQLGVSPISCTPYVLSLNFPLTFGELTIIFNAMLMIVQILILRKKYKWGQLVQLPMVVIFGYFIDLAMHMIIGLNASSYILQALYCILSCIVMAFGIFIIVQTNMTYLPGDGLAVVIANIIKKDFGKVKIGFDSSMVVIGMLSSFFLLHNIQGIREGTLISAMSVGYLVKFYSDKLPMVNMWLAKIPKN